MNFYSATAYNSQAPRDLAPAGIERSALTMAQAPEPLELPPGPHCGEHMADLNLEMIQALQTDLRDYDQLGLSEPPTLDWPTAWNPLYALQVFTALMGIGIFAGGCGAAFIAVVHGRDFALESTKLVLMPCLTLFLFGYLLTKSGWVKNVNNIIFNRRTGLVTIAKPFSTKTIPFDEFVPYHNYKVGSAGATHYFLHLIHRYSKAEVKSPAGFSDLPSLCAYWEFLVHYMDISLPLPDLPDFEASRSFDPTTTAYDSKHGRPREYWRKMDLEKAQYIKSTAWNARMAYPWGLSRQQAISQGWQPSGFELGDW